MVTGILNERVPGTVSVGALSGRVIDGLRVISDGLAAGDRVIVNGIQKIYPGAKVTVTPHADKPAAGSGNGNSCKAIRPGLSMTAARTLVIPQSPPEFGNLAARSCPSFALGFCPGFAPEQADPPA